jgi:thioredoxin-related protein
MNLRKTIVALIVGWLALVASNAVQAAELVMFETAGCAWCAKWHAEVGPGYAKSTEGQRAPLRTHKMEDAANAGVALTTPVTMSPTFVLTDQGREVGRIIGYPGADFFWGLLDQLMKKLPPIPS